MNPNPYAMDQEKFDAIVLKLVRDHNLKVEQLTEQQLAEAIRQALASGEFVRHIRIDGQAQSITYLPWFEAARLRRLYDELVEAIPKPLLGGISQHEAALLGIKLLIKARDATSKPNP